ncbi:MAG TPA: ABC transporter permease [Chloroflexota bacterium]|nr:ABC transporter permease [Chloroflexota bacterium]
MIALQSLLPPQAPRAAFRKLVLDEFVLTRRTPNRGLLGLGLPLLLLIVLGSIPKLSQPETALGGLSFIEVYIPTLIGFVITATGFLGLPLPLATYREQGILRRLSTTPVPPAWLLGAQLVVNLAIAVVGIVVLVGVAMAAFGMAVPKSSLGFILAILLTMVAIFAIGLLIAAVANGASVAQSLGGIVFAPLMFFAGLWVPMAVLPVQIRDISTWTPLGAATEAIQDAMQTGFPSAGQLLILAAYAIVAGALAVRFFRWE